MKKRVLDVGVGFVEDQKVKEDILEKFGDNVESEGYGFGVHDMQIVLPKGFSLTSEHKKWLTENTEYWSAYWTKETK